MSDIKNRWMNRIHFVNMTRKHTRRTRNQDGFLKYFQIGYFLSAKGTQQFVKPHILVNLMVFTFDI